MELSKARICGRSLVETAGSNAAGGKYVSCVLCVAFATGRSPVQRSPTECGVSLCVI